MNVQRSSTIDIKRPGVRNGSETHLQGVWLVMARVAWVVIALFATGLLVASLQSYFAYLHVTNTTSIYGPQLAPGDVRELHALGLSLDFYAWLNIGVFLIFWLICISIGVMLFLRRPNDRLALLASLTLVLFPIGFNMQIMGTLPPAWTLPTEAITFFSAICLGLFLFLFPSGRFVPRWSRWFIVVWIVYWAILDFFPNSPLNNSWLFAVPLVVLVASLIALQVYRYRRVSTPLQRQQTKWVVFGIAVTFGGVVVSIILVDGLLPQFVPMDPLSIAFAILHSRLWEIDRLISRTLVYGTLTLSLGLIYAGLVIGFQALLRGFIGQTNDVAIVVSTLLIAALFQPLRRGIQAVIDRRFYRHKYDAARTLAAFSATLRSEVDLNELREHLLAVVQETMQPAHVSLWLRPSGERSRSKVPGGQPGGGEGVGG